MEDWMRLPDFSNSADRFVDEYGLYHLTRLHANPRASAVAEAFGRAQRKLALRIVEHRAAGQATSRALADRDSACEEIEDLLRRLTTVLHDRGTEVTAVSPCSGWTGDGEPNVSSSTLQERITSVRTFLAKLNGDTEPELQSYLSAISSALESLTDAVREYRTALAARAHTYRRLEEGKHTWLSAYRWSHERLREIYPEDPKRALHYFRPARRGSGGETAVGRIRDLMRAGTSARRPETEKTR